MLSSPELPPRTWRSLPSPHFRHHGFEHAPRPVLDTGILREHRRGNVCAVIRYFWACTKCQHSAFFIKMLSGDIAMKMKEVQDMTGLELEAKERELRQELFQLKMKARLGQAGKPSRIRDLRRDIARVLTVSNGRPKPADKEKEKVTSHG